MDQLTFNENKFALRPGIGVKVYIVFHILICIVSHACTYYPTHDIISRTFIVCIIFCNIHILVYMIYLKVLQLSCLSRRQPNTVPGYWTSWHMKWFWSGPGEVLSKIDSTRQTIPWNRWHHICGMKLTRKIGHSFKKFIECCWISQKIIFCS